MISRDEALELLRSYEKYKHFFIHNYKLLDIFEGNLKEYVENNLKQGLSPQSYENTKDRIAPVNILTKIVDKMSTIYTTSPSRSIAYETGTDADKELLGWYEEKMGINPIMQDGTELFNLSKSHLVQPYVNNDGLPAIRVVPNDRFFVCSNDSLNPMNPTHVVTFDCYENDRKVFYIYTADDFAIWDTAKNDFDKAAMIALGNADGVNPFGRIPFVYCNASRFRLMPCPDSDVMSMTILLPVLLTDLNYAVKFQAFSIMYGIDVDDENLAIAPNVFWRFKSDPASSKPPEIGSIKPEVEIQSVLSLIQSEVSLWLNTKGIRPGSIGKLEADNFASGISKVIDEADTLEHRQKLIDYYTDKEIELWDLIMHAMVPVWTKQGLIENKALFSPEAKLTINFALQAPAKTRSDLVNELKLEVDAGFQSRKRALKQLNPLMSDEEIDQLMEEIDGENTVDVAMLNSQPQDQADNLPPQDANAG